MPLITCPYCANPVTLPDPWTAPGFTCPHCGNTAAIAVTAAPVAPPTPRLAPEPLPLDHEPFLPSTRVAGTRRPSNGTRNRAEDEARGKKMIFLGYAAFVVIPAVIVIGLAVYMFGGSDKKTDNPDVVQKPNGNHPPDAKKPDSVPKHPVPRPKRNDKDPDDEVPTTPPSEVKKSTDPQEPKKPEPVATIAIAPAPHPVPTEVVLPKIPTSEPIASAPAPRAIRPGIAPPPGFVSDWEQVGAVEVRVAGVAVTHVPITDADGKEVESPVAVLTIWLEARTMSKSRTIELKRWQDSLGSAAELTIARTGSTLPRGLLGPGAKLRTGLPYKQVLPPDGTPRMDVIVFTSPPDESGDLRLALDADRVGETGKFKFTIPAKAWKK